MTEALVPKGLISVAEALRRVLALAKPLPAETVSLALASGRYLAAPVTAARDQPPFDASAMDGYALADDPAPGDRYAVIGAAAAGHGFTGTLGPGQAVRIFTGAPVPQGARRVVIQENTCSDGAQITISATDSGLNIRPRGQDFRIGDQITPRRLRPVDLALLAAMNVPQLSVSRRPVVAVITTGDELVWPGQSPEPSQIIASNAFALKAMAEAEGAILRLLPIARDSRDSLAAVFELARDADVIVTIGGASVGDHDLVAQVAADLGMRAAFWKLALRPGKPLMAGQLFDAILLGLPGNPVSAVVCAELFLRPLLRALQGAPEPEPRLQFAPLGADMPANGPRAHYMRARLAADGSITAFERQDSALLSVLGQADALLIRPENDEARRQGERVAYLPL